MFLYILDGDEFLNAMYNYPHNWVLVPVTAKTVRLFHSCFTVEKKLLPGVQGCQSTAPFKQIAPAGVSSSISIPPKV
jgi:hypothetical protein